MFDNILGNEKIKELLVQANKNKKISHSYMFIGTEGIGKKIIAKEFAKMILCTSENQYCGKCKSCIEFNTNNNPDFKIIEPDGNSIKIEQIRDFQTKVLEKPIISGRKVYIINDSDKMTKEAQNCLLKTLEEPPEFITIILIASNESSFLTTIKSRCMIIHFDKIPNGKIEKFLEDNYQTKIDSSTMIQAFQGSIGKAIQLREKKEQYEKVEEILYNLEKTDKVDILKMAEGLYKAKDEKDEILEYINVLLLELAKRSSKYANCIPIVEETKRRFQYNANYDMSIDNMLFNFWEQVN